MNNLFNVRNEAIGDMNIFNKWVQSRNIVKYLGSGVVWRKVTTKGMRGLRFCMCPDEFPLRDHVTLWRDKHGKKVLVSQPYEYYPGDMKSIYAPPNEYYVKGKSEENSIKKFNELRIWCKERNLEVRFYSSTESWYYPCHTILIEIREI